MATVFLRILLGFAADRWAHRRLWLFKSIGYITAGLLIMAAITNPAPVGVIGMGWNVVAFSLTISLVPHERVGTSQGVLNALVFGAWGISTIITGLLVQTFSWSVAWLVLAVLAVSGAVIARTKSFYQRS